MDTGPGFDEFDASKAAFCVKERVMTATGPFKVIQGHRFWYQSKARMRLPISE